MVLPEPGRKADVLEEVVDLAEIDPDLDDGHIAQGALLPPHQVGDEGGRAAHDSTPHA